MRRRGRTRPAPCRWSGSASSARWFPNPSRRLGRPAIFPSARGGPRSPSRNTTPRSTASRTISPADTPTRSITPSASAASLPAIRGRFFQRLCDAQRGAAWGLSRHGPPRRLLGLAGAVFPPRRRPLDSPADEGDRSAGIDPGGRSTARRRAGRLGEGSGGERDDRGHDAQRSGTDRPAGSVRVAAAFDVEKYPTRAANDLDRDRPDRGADRGNPQGRFSSGVDHRGPEAPHDGDHRRVGARSPRRLHRLHRLSGPRPKGVVQRGDSHRLDRPGHRRRRSMESAGALSGIPAMRANMPSAARRPPC